MKKIILIVMLFASAAFAEDIDSTSYAFHDPGEDFIPIITFYETEKSTNPFSMSFSNKEVGKLDLTDPENPVFTGDMEKCRKVFYESTYGFPFLIDRYFRSKGGEKK